jgi:hypothetical protein
LRDLIRGHPRTPPLLDLFLETNFSFVLQGSHLLDASHHVIYISARLGLPGRRV